MRELLDVIDAAATLDGSQIPYALATVVATEGSTYRKPGARQLVSEDRSVGTVSGGCLDSQVRATAGEVIADGEPRLEVYDLTADDDLVWGWGLGCSGITEVLFEPSSSAGPLLAALQRGIAEEVAVTSVTLLEEGRLGERLIGSHGTRSGSISGLEDAAERAIAAGAEGVVDLEGHRAYVDVVSPPNRLVVFGANEDARPLVAAASQLGWSPVVVDPRPRLLTEERFPGAHLLITAEPAEAARVVPLDERSYVVLMNHNFIRDGDALTVLFGTPIPYLGLLGPSERARQLIGYAEEQGVSATNEDRAKIAAPAGLDVGAEGPLEIAWAIMTQVLARSRDRAGGPFG